MSFADKKGIAVASGFKLQAEALLDARQVVETITERDELVTIHAATAGLTVFVKENNTLYVYNGTGWDELSKGTAYTHPTGAGYEHIPAGGSAGQILKWQSDGKAQWAAENTVTVDSALSGSSTNPVQNKVIKTELDQKMDSTLKGAVNGVAELDESGKVPSSQLPSYVDDVLEFDSQSAFPGTGESGKIYVAKDTNKTYRWSGSAYVEISASLALGETSSTAYPGDKGKTAYEHSQAAHAPADAEANVQSDWNETDTSSDAYIKNKPTSMPADGGDADTVGGHTVEVNVPANAVFTDTKPVNMVGATASQAGSAGYAPAPAAGDQAKYLRADGSWQTPPNTTYTEATQSQAGLMSAADKKKVDTMPQIYFQSELPETAPVGSLCFLIG